MKYVLIVLALVAIIAAGVIYSNKDKNESADSTNTQSQIVQKTEEAPDTSATETTQPTTPFTAQGTKIATNYYQYSSADYDAARLAKKPIFLYFYANWCPTCAAQEPIVRQLMDQISDESKLDDFVAFRVNFNDSDTDKDETALSKTFGVSYQHTMFVLDENGTQIKKLLGQTSLESLKSALLLAV